MWKNTLTIKQNSIWELQQQLNNLEYIEIHLKRNPTENSIQKKKKKKSPAWSPGWKKRIQDPYSSETQ